ncbi:hypothetical protein DFH09DRAFT_1274176 [Mycena vulgaris]|nr:hypothetical protein DFH09DRAFT_1274176 [Mycena vulgaris]
MPSGHVPYNALDHPQNYGGLDHRIPVPQEAVNDLRKMVTENIGPREDHLSWVSNDFNNLAHAIYKQIGKPELSLSTAWDGFQAMLEPMANIIEAIQNYRRRVCVCLQTYDVIRCNKRIYVVGFEPSLKSNRDQSAYRTRGFPAFTGEGWDEESVVESDKKTGKKWNDALFLAVPLQLEGPAHENSTHPKCYYLHCINPPVHAEFWRFFKKGQKPTCRRLRQLRQQMNRHPSPAARATGATEGLTDFADTSSANLTATSVVAAESTTLLRLPPPLLPAITLQPFLAGIESHAKAPVHHPRWIDPEEQHLKNLVRTIAPSLSPSPSPSKRLPPAMPAPSAKYSLTVISWACQDKPARIQGLQLSVPFWQPPGDLSYEVYDAGFGHWLEVDAAFVHDISNGLPPPHPDPRHHWERRGRADQQAHDCCGQGGRQAHSPNGRTP